jgi:uncharacterized protein YraI
VTVENLPADLPVYPAGNVPPEVAFVPIESGEPQLTFNEATYVRTGPGEIYPAYGIAKVGMTARVIGKSDDGLWWQVKLPTELVGEGNGWVNGAYVTATNVSAVPVVPDPPLPPVIQVTPLQEGDPYLIALTGVNVRTAPSTDAEVIGVAPVGYQFKVTGVTADGNWYRVELPADKVGTDTGWMSADYVYAYNVEGVEVVTP